MDRTSITPFGRLLVGFVAACSLVCCSSGDYKEGGTQKQCEVTISQGGAGQVVPVLLRSKSKDITKALSNWV